MRLTHTGHHILPDDSVLRLDMECGRYCVSWYTPESVLKAYACGTLAQMIVVAAAWSDAFTASLIASPAVVVGDTAAAGDIPGGGQTLKETA